jgi:hypothetical protein
MNVLVVLPLELDQPSLHPIGRLLDAIEPQSARPVCGSGFFRSRPMDVSCGVKLTSSAFWSESVFTAQRS